MMMKFLDSKKFRVLISLCVLLVVGIITTVVSFSNTYDWVETDVDKLYKSLLTQNDELINSNIYLVTDEFITRIEPNTTIEEFTANINRDDFILTFNNVKVSEGLVKTGMVLTRGEEHYTLVVAGDLNKDGLMNYIDISMMIDNTKSQPADKIIRLANDFNEDGHYDKTDVDNAVDYVLNGKIELKDVKNDIRATSLEIVSGELGDNNWYRGDIVVKIGTNGAKDTSYKVIGTSIQEGVGISDGAEVTLSGYGAYKIIAWNYNEEGVRSNVTTMTFKIDDREIVPTVTYSTTEPTSKKVIATISFNKENVVVTNNNKNNEYTFYKNDNFQFQYRDVTGRVGRTTAMVNWMEDAVGADGEWRYYFVDDDEIYLREYLGEMYDGMDFVVPAEYDGYKVYGVGNNNLNGGNIFGYTISSLNSIRLEEGIKEIGISGFRTIYVYENFTFPDSLEIIRDSAFSESEFYGEFKFSDNIKIIDHYAFNLTRFLNVEDLELPSGLVEIGSYAFASDRFTGSLVIPEGVTSIGDYAFAGNDFSGDLVIPDSVTDIGNYAFMESGFGNLVIGNGVTHIYKKTFMDTDFSGTLTLGNKVKEIKNDAFYGASFTGDLVIPDSVEKIDETAFGATGFDGTLTLGKNVKNIGVGAFVGVKFTGDLVIPDKVETISLEAFAEGNYNGTLTLGSSLRTIGSGAFKSNNFTGDLVIPDSVITIGEGAFFDSGFDGTLTLGANLEVIGENAFCETVFEGDLIIPDSVITIGGSAFYQSGFSGTLTLGENLERVNDDAFFNCNFTGDLVIPDKVEYIGSTAFMYNGFNGTLTLGNSLYEVGSYAFADNRFTGGLRIPNSVEYVYEGAFSGVTYNGDFTLDGTLCFLGDSAFAGSPNLYGTVYYSQVGSYDGNPFENSSIGFFDDTMYG